MIVVCFLLRRCKSNIIFNYYNQSINKKFESIAN